MDLTRFIVIAWLVMAALPLLGGGCSDSGQEEKPAEVHWGRDVCERCRMILSERAYAAQLRDAQGQARLFDDFGDLVAWLIEQKQIDQPLKLWVADLESGQWLDARTAFYSRWHTTPMGFGFAAHAAAGPGRIPLAAVVELVKAGKMCGPEHREAREREERGKP